MLLKHVRGQRSVWHNSPKHALPRIQPCYRICSAQLALGTKNQRGCGSCVWRGSPHRLPEPIFLHCCLRSSPPNLYLKLTLHDVSPHFLFWCFHHGRKLEAGGGAGGGKERKKMERMEESERLRREGKRGRKGLKGLGSRCPALCLALSI